MRNPLFAFATCLRHAFMTGAGYEKDHEPIEVADLDRWVNYDPPNVGAFKTMADVLAVAGNEDAKVFVPAPSTTGVSIVAAAIKFGEIIISVPRPCRHHDAVNRLSIAFNLPICSYSEGFLTSAGTFVDRETALELAIKSGQFNAPAAGKRELFSEDLW